MIPATKRAPPPMNTGRTFAHANRFPERIVSRQELAAAATSTGPSTTMIIPRMKISDLNLSRNPWEATSFPAIGGELGGYLILCYYPLAFKEKNRDVWHQRETCYDSGSKTRIYIMGPWLLVGMVSHVFGIWTSNLGRWRPRRQR